MKKRVSAYLIAVISVFALQSCVSNYVVSQPIIYKTDAKVASADTKINTTPSQSEVLKATFAAASNIEKNTLINDAIRHAQNIDQILSRAETYLGTPYRYGGMSRSGIDCSAFVLSVFSEAMGMQLPRVAAAQSQEGRRVEKTELEKGDLVFFSQGGRISHVGIVHDVTPEGDIKFIHAATSRGVMISSLNDKYWGPKFRFAKRIIE